MSHPPGPEQPPVPRNTAGNRPAYRAPTGWLAAADARHPSAPSGLPGGTESTTADTTAGTTADIELSDAPTLPREPATTDSETQEASPPTRPPGAAGAPAAGWEHHYRKATGSWDPDYRSIVRMLEPCPHCQTRPAPDDLYCLGCRYEFATGRLPAPAVIRRVPSTATLTSRAVTSRAGASRAGASRAVTEWDAVVEVDPEYFARLDDDDLRLPEGRPRRVIPLRSAVIPVGAHRDGPAPAINLIGPLRDPAVSGRHARLERQADGSYAVVDRGSRNGTSVNDSTRQIRPHEAVPLRDGDRVYLGAWTRITVRCQPASPAAGGSPRPASSAE